MGAPSVESKLAQFGDTQRRDAWWVELLPVVILLEDSGFMPRCGRSKADFTSGDRIFLPFYSPLIDQGHRWWKFSPALLILAGPLGFRTTCYYYRKAYYRAFFLDPPACAVGESSKRNYKGETAFPFILQNIHRYFCIWRFCSFCFCGMTPTKLFSLSGDCAWPEFESDSAL